MGSGRGQARRAKGLVVSGARERSLSYNRDEWVKFVEEMGVKNTGLYQYYLGPLERGHLFSDADHEKVMTELFADMIDAGAFTLPDPYAAEDFEFEMMGRLPGVKPIRGKHKFMASMPKTLTAMFPNGLNMKLITVVAEGPHVAIQAESDTVAGNGKKYANRYHFYFLFNGDRLAQVREYNDVNLVREVFFS